MNVAEYFKQLLVLGGVRNSCRTTASAAAVYSASIGTDAGCGISSRPLFLVFTIIFTVIFNIFISTSRSRPLSWP
jgi:hypothetical protein